MARRKTPAQIEEQSNRLILQNWQNGDDPARSRRIIRATSNVRVNNGYFNTGSRTRNMDTIFSTTDGRRRFTVQQGREVTYRGSRGANPRGITISQESLDAFRRRRDAAANGLNAG